MVNRHSDVIHSRSGSCSVLYVRRTSSAYPVSKTNQQRISSVSGGCFQAPRCGVQKRVLHVEGYGGRKKWQECSTAASAMEVGTATEECRHPVERPKRHAHHQQHEPCS